MKAVFLDRDGVINENRRDDVKSWEEFKFLPGAIEAIAQLSRAGFMVFVISNQAIVNRGIVPVEIVDMINRRMMEEIDRQGGRITAVAYCPHRPEELCTCRKPRPGLLLNLMSKFGLDPAETVVIGDALSDIEAALSAGSRAMLVLTGRGQDQLRMASGEIRRRFLVASDLGEAISRLLTPEALAA